MQCDYFATIDTYLQQININNQWDKERKPIWKLSALRIGKAYIFSSFQLQDNFVQMLNIKVASTYCQLYSVLECSLTDIGFDVSRRKLTI
jgi:hypothetical protein